MCQVLSSRSLQRRFSFNFEFHHNYLIDYLIGNLMFDVIITSFEIFELLLGCNMHSVVLASSTTWGLGYINIYTKYIN